MRQSRNEFLNFLANNHHHVGELVDDDHDERQRRQHGMLDGFFFVEQVGRRECRILDRIAGRYRVANLAVVAADIAHSKRRHQRVTSIHLGHTPTQRIGRFPHVRHDRCQQMWNALINRKLEHFRVDHDQAHMFRMSLVKNAEHHRVDGDGFARTRCTCNQEMRHSSEIDNDRVTANILPQCQRHGRIQVVIGTRFDDLTKRNELTIFVRYLQPDEGLAGNNLDDTNADHRQRPRQILRKACDLAHFDAGRRIELEASNDRTRRHRLHIHVDAEVLQLELHQPRHRFERAFRVAGFLMSRRIVK